MHSFHQSRGKLFLELSCMMVAAAALAAAWIQTGATALLAASGALSLYGMIRVFPGSSPLAAAPELSGPGQVGEEPAERDPEAEDASAAAITAGEESLGAQRVEERHPPIEQLFDPEPFVRNQRAVFGRKTEMAAASRGRRSKKSAPA